MAWAETRGRIGAVPWCADVVWHEKVCANVLTACAAVHYAAAKGLGEHAFLFGFRHDACYDRVVVKVYVPGPEIRDTSPYRFECREALPPYPADRWPLMRQGSTCH